MTDKFYFKSRLFFKYWYPIFTVFCILNLLTHLLLPLNTNFAFIFFFIVPFFHCGCIWIYMFIVFILERKEKGWNSDSRYHVENIFSAEERLCLMANYPKIYEKLVPNGIKVDIFALEKFKKGDYDNGKDERIVLIRKKMKLFTFVPVFAFSLLLVNCFLGLIVILMKSIL